MILYISKGLFIVGVVCGSVRSVRFMVCSLDPTGVRRLYIGIFAPGKLDEKNNPKYLVYKIIVVYLRYENYKTK